MYAYGSVCDWEVSAGFVTVIPGIVVGLAVGLDTEGYGSQQRYVPSTGSCLFTVANLLSYSDYSCV